MTHKQIRQYEKQLKAITEGKAEEYDKERLTVLQTAVMIDMCRTASKNYCIAFICALVALAAAMAAWAAVYLNILDAMEKTLF